jgi:hypothetical protein
MPKNVNIQKLITNPIKNTITPFSKKPLKACLINQISKSQKKRNNQITKPMKIPFEKHPKVGKGRRKKDYSNQETEKDEQTSTDLLN